MRAARKKGESEHATKDRPTYQRKISWTYFTAPVIDLRKATFEDVRAKYVDLRGALLDEAKFKKQNQKCTLKGANLEYASLRKAEMLDTELVDADLRDADLTDAKLMGANLSGANLTGANLAGADLTNADISGARLVGANLAGCQLDGARVHGVSAWDIFTDRGTSQKGLIITNAESEVRVDDIEVAQFIYLLLNREKLRNVLNTITKKGVLILGRFKNDGLKVLTKVADKIREKGYMPMLFDFEGSESRSETETVKIMVGLSRFVIVDLSGPSVSMELQATVPDNQVPFIPIIEESRECPSMIPNLAMMHDWFNWPPVRFKNTRMLLKNLEADVIKPAEKLEKRIKEKKDRVKELS